MVRSFRNCIAVFLALVWPGLSPAHPHVFVDGGVDFGVNEDGQLASLKVTWLYDAFETLYILSSHEMSLNSDGGLDEEDRLRLTRLRSKWPADFDGSAHLTIDTVPIALAWPSGLDAQLVDGRLQVTFFRHLVTPVDIRAAQTEVAFYESTYFFAFSVTNTPKVIGGGHACKTRVLPFKSTPKDTALQATLAALSREETPTDRNVGALFADRITLTCGS